MSTTMDASLELVASNKSFGGWHKRYRHRSASQRRGGVRDLPAAAGAVAAGTGALLALGSDLQRRELHAEGRRAAHRGRTRRRHRRPGHLATRRRGPGDPDGAWDFGHGAGFYLNASEAPWHRHYRMYDYVVDELPALVEAHFPVSALRSVSGHSMGGHGALVCALRNPGRYRSVSAFAPICNPSDCPWGQKAFSRYLGNDRRKWSEWDASALLVAKAGERLPLLVDQGRAGRIPAEQLKPGRWKPPARPPTTPHAALQPGYDHSYFFIASFIDDHLRHHAGALYPR